MWTKNLSFASFLALLGSLLSFSVHALPCGTIVSNDTTLSRNVGPCTGTALYLTGDRNTLDLNGYEVFSTAGTVGHPINSGGVVVLGTFNTVRNGRISGFEHGISASGTRGTTAHDLVIRNSGTGIYFGGGETNVVDAVHIENARTGVIFKEQSMAIGIVGSAAGRLVVENADRGVSVERCAQCLIIDSQFWVRQVSVQSVDSLYLHIGRNLFFGGYAGILVSNAGDLTVRGNSFFDSSMSGILFQPPHSSSSVSFFRVENNQFYNIPYAIDFFGGQGRTNNGTFRDNTVHGGFVGFWIDSPAHRDHTLERNQLYNQSWQPFVDHGLRTIYLENLCNGMACP